MYKKMWRPQYDSQVSLFLSLAEEKDAKTYKIVGMSTNLIKCSLVIFDNK